MALYLFFHQVALTLFYEYSYFAWYNPSIFEYFK